MVKKSLALCGAVLILSLFLCFSVSADSPLTVRYTYTDTNGGTTVGLSPVSPFSGMFDSMIAAYGSPVAWAYSSNGIIGATAHFDVSSSPVYWIVPRYEVSTSNDGGATFASVYYSASSPAVSAGDWVEVDSRTLENITSGSVTIDYQWTLYKYTGWREGVLECSMLLSGSDYAFLDYPIFAPQAFSSGGGGTGEESGGGGTGEESGGGGSSCQQWDALNLRLDLIEAALSAIDFDIKQADKTTEKVFESVEKLREDLKEPTPHQKEETSKAEQNLADVNSAVSQFIDDMSIPQVVFNPSVPSLPDDNGNATDVIGFVTNLYPLNIILPLGVGLWVTYLIIHGVRSS